MAAWYYAAGKDQKGPVGEDEISGLIKSGQITKETIVWREGMDDWQRAVEQPELSSAFSTPPPLPNTPSPKIPPPIFEPPVLKAGVVIISRPWPRFWARFIDNLIFVPMLGFGIGLWAVLYAPDIYLQIVMMNGVLFGVLLLPLVALFLALCMIVVGTTPGKAIVGVRVPVDRGRNRLGFYLSREFKVWAAGLGLGIPFVALFTQVRQYRLLAAGKSASYDEGHPAIIANPSKVRLAASIVVVAALFTGNIILRAEDQKAETNLNTTQAWINPVTNKTTTIGKTWQAQEMKTNSGRTFYFASNELLAEAIFGYEQFPSYGVQAAAYADAIKAAVASDVRITSQWQPVLVQGMPALRATGKSVKYTDSIVDVTIVVKGRDAWRTLVFSRGNSPAQSAEKEKFVKAMFGTAN
ncbi:RDD family protein [Agrobacterium salinitolerans]|uniref:RDD family protein n=1 Tax=Agrobacterium salinitolerans TaxID=1183413 RepID=A0ABY3BHL9_9HYPH|nr:MULTISPECIES: RDD family protein [Agrobacterium]MCZ7894714.1 RDD family protein [Agrobacterium salinitolerans]TRA83541.1 RDD family protein [Agrobacterium salinitolerans]